MIFEAGNRQSRASYGQLRLIVVVKGMKKESKGTKGEVEMSLSRRRGLEFVSHLVQGAPTLAKVHKVRHSTIIDMMACCGFWTK
jgi:hypothetical protein